MTLSSTFKIIKKFIETRHILEWPDKYLKKNYWKVHSEKIFETNFA